jgi:REP element-mobilizing transposase RayT
MSTGYQIKDQYATHFITPTIVDWVDVFTRKIYRDIMIDSLTFCIRERGLKLYGYVIMTNHLHLIVRSEAGKLSDTIRDFKKFTARAIIDNISNQPESRRPWMLHRFEWNAAQNERSSDHQFWTHENHPEEVFSQIFFNQKLTYIHQNPVRAGWVENAEEYLYSSAKALLKNVNGQLPLTDWYG